MKSVHNIRAITIHLVSLVFNRDQFDTLTGLALVAFKFPCVFDSCKSTGMSTAQLLMVMLCTFIAATNSAVIEGTSRWGKWSDWSECDVPCGSGNKNRSRSCKGEGCVGDSEATRICQADPCPESEPSTENWTEWSDWSECDVPCGSGNKNRSRSCGGEGCVGDSEEMHICQAGPCPVNGDWTKWSHWGECDVKCGTGMKNRSRVCIYAVPEYGDAPCEGDSQEFDACESKDCSSGTIREWAAWVPWSECDMSCGPGIKYRDRICSGSAENGTFCAGQWVQMARCEDQPCENPPDWAFGELSDWQRPDLYTEQAKGLSIGSEDPEAESNEGDYQNEYGGEGGDYEGGEDGAYEGGEEETDGEDILLGDKPNYSLSDFNVNVDETVRKKSIWSPAYLERKSAELEPIRNMCDGRTALTGITTVAYWERTKLAYCPIPKVASMFLYEMTKDVSAKMGPLVYSPPETEWRTNDTFRFMFVRDPLARLWSGYIDKILLPGFWHREDPVFYELNLWNCTHVPTFESFMAYMMRRDHNQNALCTHWAPLKYVCDVCYFKPDFIGKLEDFETDMAYLADRFNFTDEFHETFRTEAHMRDFLLVPNMLKMYDEHHMSSCGLTKIELMRRLWYAAQMNGRIDMTSEFPEADFLAIEPIRFREYRRCLAIFNKHRLSGSENNGQRIYQQNLAFARLPKYLRTDILNMFRGDFELFGYPVNPILQR